MKVLQAAECKMSLELEIEGHSKVIAGGPGDVWARREREALEAPTSWDEVMQGGPQQCESGDWCSHKEMKT